MLISENKIQEKKGGKKMTVPKHDMQEVEILRLCEMCVIFNHTHFLEITSWIFSPTFWLSQLKCTCDEIYCPPNFFEWVKLAHSMADRILPSLTVSTKLKDDIK